MTIADRLTASLAGRYHVERELGRGGMGAVYLARDLRHDREVAVKVLDAQYGAAVGPERFLAEIKITASLDHSHILTLIDSGEADGLLYYVMPYVRGESLRARLDRQHQLDIDAAVRIASQVASALDHAHRHGVIHRDIKPENILLRDDEALLADFGIALPSTETASVRLTEVGHSLGTPQYMSPEQATGERTLDARSDVYSLGAVTYEMLAGEPPLTGASMQAIIAKLMVERPTPLRVMRQSVTPAMEAAVAKALAKAPADRFASAGEFAAALRAPSRVQGDARRWLWSAVGVVAVLGVAGGLLAYQRLAPSTMHISIGQTEQFTSDAGLEIQPTISPDGGLIAYAAGTSARMRIYIRPVGGGRTIPLSDDSLAVETQPRWSPDGGTLLFLTRDGVSIAPALGGASRVVVPATSGTRVASATWSPDQKEIAFSRGDSLFAVLAAGGTSRVIGTGHEVHSCEWNPKGKWIACVEQNSAAVVPGPLFANQSPTALTLFPVSGGKPVRVAEPTAVHANPVWAADGETLLFISNRSGSLDIYAQPLGANGQPHAAAVRLTTGLGASSMAVSADMRRIAYAVYSAHANITSLAIPSNGPVNSDRGTPVTSGSQVIEGMRFSPDHRWLVYDSNVRGNSDIFRIPAAGGTVEQLTSDKADEFAGDLSPDGRLLAYHSWRKGTRNIEVKPLAGGAPVLVTDNSQQSQWPRWSPDGQALSYSELVPPFRAFVVKRDAAGDWAKPLKVTDHVNLPEWSPDGKWLLCVRRDAPGAPGTVVLIPSEGGPQRRLYEPGSDVPPAGQAEWSADGQLIYFKTHDERGRSAFWSIRPSGGPPRLLVQLNDLGLQSARHEFAVDANRFYYALDDRQSDVFLGELVHR